MAEGNRMIFGLFLAAGFIVHSEIGRSILPSPLHGFRLATVWNTHELRTTLIRIRVHVLAANLRTTYNNLKISSLLPLRHRVKTIHNPSSFLREKEKRIHARVSHRRSRSKGGIDQTKTKEKGEIERERGKQVHLVVILTKKKEKKEKYQGEEMHASRGVCNFRKRCLVASRNRISFCPSPLTTRAFPSISPFPLLFFLSRKPALIPASLSPENAPENLHARDSTSNKRIPRKQYQTIYLEERKSGNI